MTAPSFEAVLAGIEAAGPQDQSNGYDTARLIGIDPTLTDIEISDFEIVAPSGQIGARRYISRSHHTQAALVWAHGGAWVGGSLDMPESHWVGLALAARGVSVLTVDYHLSLHGVTFPVPSDDVSAAFTWALSHRYLLGGQSTPVSLGGASAGGNLAAGVAKRLAQGDGAVPASLVLAYPVLHPELPRPSESLARALELAGVPDVPPGLLAFAMGHFAGPSGVGDEIAFAGNGEVPRRHSPTLILNADADPLRASGELYARQLDNASIAVDVDLLPQSQHGFLNEPESPTGQAGLARIADFLLAR